MKTKIAVLFILSFFSINIAFAQEESSLQAIENEEQNIINEIVNYGFGDRFVIQGNFTGENGSCTVTVSPENGSFILKKEFPSDEMPSLMFGKMELGVNGDGSIHRFNGKIVNWVIYDNDFPIIIGTGNIENRLTFLLLKGIGYVYVRGEGEVVYPDGTTIVLPG